MDDVKMGMSVSLARSALNIQANMSAALINGTIDKGAEMEQNMRSQGLAAEGIGGKLEDKESPEECLLREVKEGVRPAAVAR